MTTITSSTVSQQYTPPSHSDFPSGSSSPTSPRSSFAAPRGAPHPATRQLRPPKSPLYVPAVLRPTERTFLRRGATPPSPPRSQYSSSDSLAGGAVGSTNNTSPQHHTRNQSHNSSEQQLQRPRTATGSKRSSSPPYLITTMSNNSSTTLTAPPSPSSASTMPTRAHWKPDSQVTTCEAPGCGLAFSLLTRRHHCRRCGGVFCAEHSQGQVPLDKDAVFDDRGLWSRACAACAENWAAVVVARLEECRRAREGKGGATATEEEGVPIRGQLGGDQLDGGGGGGGDGNGNGNRKKENKEMPVGSVPKDWSWSTF